MINKQASSFQYFHLPASILNYLQLSSSFPYNASIYFFTIKESKILIKIWIVESIMTN